MKLKSQARAPRWVTRLSRWAPLLVAVASTHCGSDDNAKESEPGAGGTASLGVTTATATTTSTTTTATTTSGTNSTTSTVGNTLTTTATTTTTTTTGSGETTTTG